MRVLRMVGCECRVMSVLVDCVMVVVNVHVKGVAYAISEGMNRRWC